MNVETEVSAEVRTIIQNRDVLDGDLVRGLPKHTVVDVGNNDTSEPCTMNTGYVRIEGGIPHRQVVVKCGLPNSRSKKCFRVWK